MFDTPTEKRSYWTFKYTAARVAEGAALQREFRATRKEWWATKKQEIMDKIKESGVQINESVADQLMLQKVGTANSYSTRSLTPTVTIDPHLQQQLAECHSKIREHHDAMETYAGWVQVLRAQGDAMLELTHEDWLYFFGKK